MKTEMTKLTLKNNEAQIILEVLKDNMKRYEDGRMCGAFDMFEETYSTISNMIEQKKEKNDSTLEYIIPTSKVSLIVRGFDNTLYSSIGFSKIQEGISGNFEEVKKLAYEIDRQYKVINEYSITRAFNELLNIRKEKEKLRLEHYDEETRLISLIGEWIETFKGL